MKTIKISFILLISIATFGTSCKKDDEQAEPINTAGPSGPTGSTGTSFSYNSLTAENTTINTGETSKITATASGENLTYNWELISGSLGDILGSGAQVTYTASPCCTGDNTVQCTVSDGTNSESKTVTIVVQ